MSVRWVRIGDVARRRTEPIKVDPNATYRMLGLLNHGRGAFDRGPIRGTETKYSYLHEVRDGDLVYSRLFGWEGSVAIADRDGWVSPEFPVYSVQHDVDLGYLRHAVASERFVDQLARGTVDMGQRRQRVPPTAFESASIPLPDLDEQRRVAARLDAVEHSVLRVRARRESRSALADLGPRAISSVFVSSNIARAPSRELYTTVNDVVHPGDDPTPAERFVGLEHIEANMGRRIGAESIEAQKGRKLRFAQGDVLYGYLRPYLNKVWVADGPGLTSVEQYVLRPRDGVDSRLLAYALRSSTTLEQVVAATHRLQLPRIRLALLGDVLVPDVRHVPTTLLARLNSAANHAADLVDLDRLQGKALAALLPAARNEEFSRLVAQAV